MSSPAAVEAVWLGRRDFASTLAQQLEARDALAEGQGPARLFMVEHEPTVTLGRRATPEDVLWTEAQLQRAGLAVCETPRGGEATLHAPGQLVAYPVVRVGRRIRQHIVDLAEATVDLLTQLGVEGSEFRMEHPGVWLAGPAGDRKIASIGIHVSRGITVQGLSLNIDVAPNLFEALVSCGMPQVRMTSVREETAGLGPDSPDVPDMPELARRWGELYAGRAGLVLDWVRANPE